MAFRPLAAAVFLLAMPILLLAQCPTYTIVDGDTLSSIADAQGTTVSALEAANPGVQAESLHIDDVLNLPCSDSGSDSGSDTTPSTASSDGVTITASDWQSALTINNFEAVPDSVRTDMLNAISQLGGSDVISSERELAMFLAQAELETGGLQVLTESGTGTDPPYVGRGYLQLTGSGNYMMASEAILGNDTLVQDYTLVATMYPWQTAAWYWKFAVHNAPGVQDGQFGAATNAINGPLECTGSPSADVAASTQARCTYYTNILSILVPGETADCSGCGS